MKTENQEPSDNSQTLVEYNYIISSGNPIQEPNQTPEVEPDKMPSEEPGVQPNTKPKKENGDDDDDDDDNDGDYTDPFKETEIGDDPDEIKKRTTIM